MQWVENLMTVWPVMLPLLHILMLTLPLTHQLRSKWHTLFLSLWIYCMSFRFPLDSVQAIEVALMALTKNSLTTFLDTTIERLLYSHSLLGVQQYMDCVLELQRSCEITSTRFMLLLFRHTESAGIWSLLKQPHVVSGKSSTWWRIYFSTWMMQWRCISWHSWLTNLILIQCLFCN